MSRKIFVGLLALCTLLIGSPFAYASGPAPHLHDHDSSCKTESCKVIVPLYDEVCNGKAYHEMISNGRGSVRIADGTEYIRSGAAFQCSGCYLVMVTEGDPAGAYPGYIEKYAGLQFYGPTASGVIIQTPSFYGYIHSTTLNGYRFLLTRPYWKSLSESR